MLVSIETFDFVYPVVLVEANIAAGWLLYRVLDSGLGPLVAAVGVLVLLTIGLEMVRNGVCQSTA